ncbi:TniQ family protein [Amantichitinum ursilacus]|uniref:TniQ domain-containing protein n=1 Tax=Amantichitinum ursilacus TaxID=857265 RepID=A0A0N0XI34_9NEIS|nr:TniQ family protein [Amantichitinum ursilacus]KPC52283.1 hypothetical protein WG78_14530 [Amantichitinum ursilacus]
MNSDKLLFWPRRQRRESMNGYLLRLAEAHCLTSVAKLAPLLGQTKGKRNPNHLRLSDFDIQDLDRMAEALHTDVASLVPEPRWLRTRSYRDGVIEYLGRLWPRSLLRFSDRAWCPECLCSTGIALEIWEFSFVTSCDLHLRSLAHSCGRCGKHVSWRNSRVNSCHCGAALSDARTVPVPYAGWEQIAYSADRIVQLLLLTTIWGHSLHVKKVVTSIRQYSFDEIRQRVDPALGFMAEGQDLKQSLFDAMSAKLKRYPRLGPRYAAAALLAEERADFGGRGLLTAIAEEWFALLSTTAQPLDDDDGTSGPPSELEAPYACTILNISQQNLIELVQLGVLRKPIDDSHSPGIVIRICTESIEQLIAKIETSLNPQLQPYDSYSSATLAFRHNNDLVVGVMNGEIVPCRFDAKLGLPSLKTAKSRYRILPERLMG